MFVDVTKGSSSASTNWVAESGVLDVFFLLGPTPPKVRSEPQSLHLPLLCLSMNGHISSSLQLQLTKGATTAPQPALWLQALALSCCCSLGCSLRACPGCRSSSTYC